MRDSLAYLGSILGGVILVANASSNATPPRGRFQLVQLPTWGYIVLGTILIVLGATLFVGSL